MIYLIFPAWILPGLITAIQAMTGKPQTKPPGLFQGPVGPGNIAATGNILGGIGSGILAGINQRAQNRYNSPQKQVERLKQAGLPMAAYTSVGTGNQSTPTPSSDLGISAAAGNIAQYQAPLKQAEYRKDLWSRRPGTETGTNEEDIWTTEKDLAGYNGIIRGNEQIISNLDTEIKTKMYKGEDISPSNMSKQFNLGIEKLAEDIAWLKTQNKLAGEKAEDEKVIRAGEKSRAEAQAELWNSLKTGKFPNLSTILFLMAQTRLGQ